MPAVRSSASSTLVALAKHFGPTPRLTFAFNCQHNSKLNLIGFPQRPCFTRQAKRSPSYVTTATAGASAQAEPLEELRSLSGS